RLSKLKSKCETMEPGTVTRVLKDVFTTLDGELSLSKGDIFQVIKQVDKYWCYGNSMGRIGLFPSDQLISIEIPELEENEELFLAIADFSGEQTGDLSFYKGEFIVGEKKLDEHWWQGKVSLNRRGVFPDTFTWLLSSAPRKTQQSKNKMNIKARVKMSLRAQLDEEIDLCVGDIVTIIEEVDKGWYRGVCGDRSGIFPAAYVTLLDEMQSDQTDLNDHISKPNLFNSRNSLEINSGMSKSNNSFNFSQVNESNSYSNVEVDSSSKDLMTFSPEKEARPIEPNPSVDTDFELFNDDYFKLNMPSMCSGSSKSDGDSKRSDLTGKSTSSSYLTELVSELGDGNIQPYGMTLYPFYAQYANELSFHENEIVHLIRYIDDGWLEGEIDGRKGIFPVSYVNILVDCERGWRGHVSSHFDEASTHQSLTPKSYAKVIYNFEAQMNGDLPVKEGETVMIMKIVDKDWYEVRNSVGMTGLCPSNHLAPESVSPPGTLFRSTSFTSNLEPLLSIHKPLPRTFEPHDFSVDYRKKENKVDDLITRNLSGLDVIPLTRKSPIEKTFIDFKEELSDIRNEDKKDVGEEEQCEVFHEQESSTESVEAMGNLKPPNYPPPPPPPDTAEVPYVASGQPVKPIKQDPIIPLKINNDHLTNAQEIKAKQRSAPPIPTPPKPSCPKRPPPPLRRSSIDKAPHRPAPPVPIAGQTPVRKSLKRLPRQTSAPCVLSEDVNDVDDIRKIIINKEKQLQEIQMVHEEIETEIQKTENNDQRTEELRQCGEIYAKKMRRLKIDIHHFKSKLDKTDADLSAHRTLPECTEQMKMKMKEQRQNVISELVMTEKEYVRDLKMTYEVFNLYNPAMLEERGIDVKALFGNILEVMQVAENFLDSLQFAMKGKSEENQCVGPVFLKHAEFIKKVYSEYCANHENALCLLEKYKAVPGIQAVFDKAMETLRYQVTCFNVGSVLIKPVQRLLKYPLILNELIKCTEDHHKDKHDLLEAVKVFTNMASDINEYKRRKDIVSKYLGDGTSTLARKMAKLNLHSVAKKSSRLSAKLSSTFGLSLAPKDESFLELERSFHALERTLRLFVRNLEAQLSYLNEEVTALFHLGEVLATFYMERSNDQDVDEFRTTQRLILSQYWEEFKKVVERRVTAPLVALLELFQGPCKIIEKRNDKLLDYDNYLAKADKNKENRQLQEELQKSKNNYEALNRQLLEDLPVLIKSSTEILVECLSALLASQKLFSGKITKQYLHLMEIPSLSSAAGDAVESFSVKHFLVCNQLGRFSFSSKAFREAGGNNRKSLKTSPTLNRQLGNDGQKLEQSTSQRAYLQSRYPSSKLFCTIEDHVAAGPLELALSKGHLVGVIKMQDPMGSSLRWFVDNGVAQGFVRKECLEEAPSRLSLSPSSSINSSISSCASSSPGKLRPDSALSERSMDHSPRQSLSPPKPSGKSPTPTNNLPPSYEEVTNSACSRTLYDEVPHELDDRYGHVGPNLDENSIYENIRAIGELEIVEEDSGSESEFYYAIYEFEGMGPQTLPLKEGQVVNILQKQDLKGNKEWWHAEDRYGRKGYVPANYLQPYTDSK
ncbi:Dynamin-binding protein, partial [Frankliniella fusca]